MVLPDVAKVTDGLRHHIDRTCKGCPYSGRPEGCLIEGLLPDALALIEAQAGTLDEIDRYVRELDQAVSGS